MNGYSILFEHVGLDDALGVAYDADRRRKRSRLRGSVEEPLVGTSARDYSVAPTLRLELGVRASEYLSACVDGSFMFLQRTDLALAGEPIGGFGPWMATASMGLEFTADW